jgi:transcriptional regulator with XRE-family HTH domain
MPFNPKSIHELRGMAGGISQFGLAKELGCTPQTILNWENGHSTPNVSMLDNLYGFCQKTGVEQPPTFYSQPRIK